MVMNAFVWELNEGGSIAVIADGLDAARRAVLGHLSEAERDTPSYHKKSACRKLRTLIESGSTPQSISVGQPPYVVLTPSEAAESGAGHGDISIGSMINSQIAIASPGATYTQTKVVLPKENLRQLLSALRASADTLGLAQADRRELQLQGDTIGTQLEREVPSCTIVGECLRSIRAILEGVAGNIVAAPILAQLIPISKQWF